MLLIHVFQSAPRRRGFTLVELVIVVLTIGILTAVAAPRMMNTAGSARTNGTRQSLVVLRDAIEFYRAKNGNFPEAANLATSLQPFLSGPFPVAQVGANPNANVVSTAQNPIASTEPVPFGWVYNETTGEIRVNDGAAITW